MYLINAKPWAMYNEIDPYAAEWLRNLIKAGQIAPGVVDERSIEDVTPDELREFTQCHFFAGIGVWSYALRRAGWPDSRPVWSGSCPCQPFSSTGKGKGFTDERHLWPSFGWLIEQCRPHQIFGEQVASDNADEWFDLVQSDLERMGYAFGLVPFPSAGVGAPHIRDRAFWMADAFSERREGQRLQHIQGEEDPQAGRGGKAGGLDNANGARLEGFSGNDGEAGREGTKRPTTAPGLHMPALEVNGFWRDADWLYCSDGKWRPVESGVAPLVNGFAKGLGSGKSSLRAMAGRNRAGRLKGYGNAINAEAARVFIAAYMESERVLAP